MNHPIKIYTLIFIINTVSELLKNDSIKINSKFFIPSYILVIILFTNFSFFS